MTSELTPEPKHSQDAHGLPQASGMGLSRGKKAAFPELYGTAAAASKQSQSLYYGLLRWELIATFVAALSQFLLRPIGPQIANLLHFQLSNIHVSVLGLTFNYSSAEVTSSVAGSFFPALAVLIVLGLTGLHYFLKPENRWHARRSLAEAVVVLSWRYTMQALPGDLTGAHHDGPDGETEFAAAYKILVDTATNMELPPPDDSRSIITDDMRSLRDADWTVKRTTYLKDRLNNQKGFYLGHAQTYHRSQNRLRWAMILCYIVGGLLLPFNGLGALTTAAGSLGTWLGAKHYTDLSQSYSAMARELEIFVARADDLSPQDPSGPQKWSQLVNEIESKLDGEHQDWLRRVELPQ